MLALFPSLLDFSILAPVLLRLVVGLLFVRYGVHKLNSKRHSFYRKGIDKEKQVSSMALRIIGMLEVLGGVFLVLGLYTQLVSLVLIVIVFMALISKRSGKISTTFPQEHYILLIAVLLSLMFLGAGIFAFDIPL